MEPCLWLRRFHLKQGLNSRLLGQPLKTNILYYIENTPSVIIGYDPVMSLPVRDGVFPLKIYQCHWTVA